MMERPTRIIAQVGAATLALAAALCANAVANGSSPATPAAPSGLGSYSAVIEGWSAQAFVTTAADPEEIPAADDSQPFVAGALTGGGAVGTASYFNSGSAITAAYGQIDQQIFCDQNGQNCKPQCLPSGQCMASLPALPNFAAVRCPGTADAQARLGTASAVAHCQPGALTESAQTASDSVPGSVTAGLSRSSGTARLDTGAGRLIGQVTASTGSVSIAAGVVQIESVVSEAVAGTDGSAGISGEATTTVSGTTVAGIPVSIDQDGVHVQQHTLVSGTAPLQKRVDEALRAAHLSISIAVPASTPTPGGLAVETEGLVITEDNPSPAPQLPAHRNRISLGHVSLSVVGSPMTPQPVLLPLPPVPPVPAVPGRVLIIPGSEEVLSPPTASAPPPPAPRGSPVSTSVPYYRSALILGAFLLVEALLVTTAVAAGRLVTMPTAPPASTLMPLLQALRRRWSVSCASCGARYRLALTGGACPMCTTPAASQPLAGILGRLGALRSETVILAAGLLVISALAVVLTIVLTHAWLSHGNPFHLH